MKCLFSKIQVKFGVRRTQKLYSKPFYYTATSSEPQSYELFVRNEIKIALDGVSIAIPDVFCYEILATPSIHRSLACHLYFLDTNHYWNLGVTSPI
jgi:hypothetical protein